MDVPFEMLCPGVDYISSTPLPPLPSNSEIPSPNPQPPSSADSVSDKGEPNSSNPDEATDDSLGFWSIIVVALFIAFFSLVLILLIVAILYKANPK